MQRYFLNEPLSTNETIPVPNEIKQHWLKVMRAQIDDQAEFVDSNHNVYIAKLVQNDDQPKMKIQKELNNNVELPIKVTIACGLPKKDKAELITMKATELGVDQIIFFPADWSIAKWNGNRINKKLTRLETIAVNAAQQSHRTIVPEVKYLKSLKDILELPFDQRIVAYEESAKQGEKSAFRQVIDTMRTGQSLLAIFGPEGGISPNEIQTMEFENVKKVGLGPRILRTETAPLYLLSAVSAFSELS